MSQKIIDLRKTAVRETRLPPQEQKKEEKITREAEKKPKNKALIGWSADEYRNNAYTRYWFVKIGAAAVLLIILGIFTQSYFFIAFIALAFIVMVMYTKRSPREIFFSIEEKGVRAGKKLYVLEDLKSFWISDTEDEKELSLETTHVLQPFVRLPLGKADAEAVRRALLVMLPEKEHEEMLTDQIARKIGF